jgi:TolB-like protein
MSKKMRSLSVCGAAMFLSLLVSSAWGYEKEIEQLSAQMAEKIAGKGKKTVAVVDFTDLQGNVTELGRFLAEELSGSLSKGERGFEVVNRSNLKQLIQEYKLFSTGVIDQKAAMKLGEFSGIEALITGTITPFTENIRVSTSVLDIKTAKAIDNERENIPRTKDINELLGKEISSESAASESAGETKQVSDKKSVMSQVVKDILFEVQECRLSGNALTCRTTATNKKDDRDIRIYVQLRGVEPRQSRMFDSLSNEQYVSSIELANKKSSDEYIDHMLVSGVKTRLNFNFENIDDNINGLALLEIAGQELASRDVFKVQFRDIPISR